MVAKPRDNPENCDRVLLSAAGELFPDTIITKVFLIVEIVDTDGETKITWAYASGTKTHHVYGMFEGFKECQLIGQLSEESEKD